MKQHQKLCETRSHLHSARSIRYRWDSPRMVWNGKQQHATHMPRAKLEFELLRRSHRWPSWRRVQHTTCFTSTTEGNYCMHGVLCFLHHARDPNCEQRNRDGAIESAVSRLPFPHTPTHWHRQDFSFSLRNEKFFHFRFSSSSALLRAARNLCTRRDTERVARNPWDSIWNVNSSIISARFRQHFIATQTREIYAINVLKLNFA